jgi:hypothetical protein
LISRDFVNLWEPRYDTQKYPVDFYLRYIARARTVNKPEHLREALLALLHWKDGKTFAFVQGEDHAKPNTLNPIITLTNAGLADFARSFQSLAQTDKNDVTACAESLRLILSGMWNTVVIPAFLLHVARPDRLPIIDQHTVRAFLALTRGKIVEKPTITWHLWSAYINFLQDAVAAAGYDHGVEERCKVDRALFAWGKSLKGAAGSQPPIATAPKGISQIREAGSVINSPNFWGQQVPETGVIPPACNVLQALQEYLDLGSFGSLPQYKKQNLSDLQFHRFQQSYLYELLQEPGGNMAGKLLQYYKEEMSGGADISRLPRPILDVFLVGWANICGIHGTTKMATHLHNSGFGGTTNAAAAAVSVGKTTGRLFGLIDDSDAPTTLFHKYFGV